MATRPLNPAGAASEALVFMYHELAASEAIRSVSWSEKRYTVPLAWFREMLRQVRESGTCVEALQTFWESCMFEHRRARSAVFTFDDGTLSHYDLAYPELSGNGVTASFFLNTATVGTAGYLTWAQVSEMRRNGMTFYSHGHDHLYLTHLGARALAWQLESSKGLLEEKLGCAAPFLAAPYGDVDARVVDAAMRAGYQAVCTSRSLPARSQSPIVNRIAIHGTDGPRQFRQMLSGNMWPYTRRFVRELLIGIPKRALIRSRMRGCPAYGERS